MDGSAGEVSGHSLRVASYPFLNQAQGPFEVTRHEALRALSLRPVLVVIALKSALNLAFASRYGWHRDELYYAVAGRHLQGGYVEFPPVTALLSALARLLFGDSLTFRVLPGRHKLQVDNTWNKKTVEFDAAPGEHLRFRAVNRTGHWGWFLLTALGVGLIWVSLEGEAESST